MIAIATGANSGMGRATSAALADKEYKVIMLCRDQKRATEAYVSLKQERAQRDLELMYCDLGSFQSIRDFVQDFAAQFDHLDVLINNAGFISLLCVFGDRHYTRNGRSMLF